MSSKLSSNVSSEVLMFKQKGIEARLSEIVCMCVCMYICEPCMYVMCMYMYSCEVCIYGYVCVYLCYVCVMIFSPRARTHAYTYICAYFAPHTHTHTHTHTRARADTHICACLAPHTHVRARAHTHARTHTHTHVQGNGNIDSVKSKIDANTKVHILLFVGTFYSDFRNTSPTPRYTFYCSWVLCIATL